MGGKILQVGAMDHNWMMFVGGKILQQVRAMDHNRMMMFVGRTTSHEKRLDMDFH